MQIPFNLSIRPALGQAFVHINLILLFSLCHLYFRYKCKLIFKNVCTFQHQKPKKTVLSMDLSNMNRLLIKARPRPGLSWYNHHMQKYFVRHKLSVGDITHLSDSDSELVISQGKLNIEDIIQVETYENVFLGQITDMSGNSVEVEILEAQGQRENAYIPSVSIIQSLSNDTKFNYFLEKSVEIGIEKIIPTETRYSLKTKAKAIKDYGMWNKVVRDATEQSRNTFPTVIEKPIRINDLLNYNFEANAVKICLATENVEPKYLEQVNLKDNPVYIAIGPEKGWSSSDLEIFKELNFEFVKLRGNILRTETAGIVMGSIVKYIKGEI